MQDAFEGVHRCWEWPLSRIKSSGYGQFNKGGADIQLVHRIAWELNRGPIPTGLFVLHECDNRPCFRHHHLFLGTALDNSADMMAKGRFNHDRALPRLEDHANARLTINAVHHIRSCDQTAVALAKVYGVSESAVRQARQGKTWTSC